MKFFSTGGSVLGDQLVLSVIGCNLNGERVSYAIVHLAAPFLIPMSATYSVAGRRGSVFI